MIKIVEINLGKGNLKRGFDRVEVKIIDEANPSENSIFVSSLPPSPKVISCYKKWKKLHKDFYESLNILNNIQASAILSMICQLPFAIEVTIYYEKWNRRLHKVRNDSFAKRPSKVYKQNLSNNVKKLVTKLKFKKANRIKFQLKSLEIAINDWLDTKDFRKTEKELRTALGVKDEIMVRISTEDDFAWRIPWHFWSFIDDGYIKAGEVFSHPESRNVHSNTNHSLPQKQVKVLAIVGDENFITDLNEWKDKKIDLEVLSRKDFLDGDPITKIADKLREQAWDILFFAGHSSSNKKNEEAEFYININDKKCYLTIEDLKDPLRDAIDKGLQLAFFNSCDGLGLARNLLKLNLPKVIVMREDVPSKVAQLFLKYFLEKFMANQESTSTFLIVKKARENLKVWEYKTETELFPGASILPVICFNRSTDLT